MFERSAPSCLRILLVDVDIHPAFVIQDYEKTDYMEPIVTATPVPTATPKPTVSPDEGTY